MKEQIRKFLSRLAVSHLGMWYNEDVVDMSIKHGERLGEKYSQIVLLQSDIKKYKERIDSLVQAIRIHELRNNNLSTIYKGQSIDFVRLSKLSDALISRNEELLNEVSVLREVNTKLHERIECMEKYCFVSQCNESVVEPEQVRVGYQIELSHEQRQKWLESRTYSQDRPE